MEIACLIVKEYILVMIKLIVLLYFFNNFIILIQDCDSENSKILENTTFCIRGNCSTGFSKI